MDDEQIEMQAQEAAAMLARYTNFAVTTADQYECAAAVLKEIKGKTAEIEDLRKSLTRPLDDSKKRIMDLFRRPLDMLTAAEGKVKRALLTYQQEQERIRQEAERVARAAQQKEQERLAKLQREAEARAAAAVAEGNEKKAAEAKKKAEEFAARKQVAEAAPTSVQSFVPAVKGLSTKKTWRAEIVNAAAIPVGDNVVVEKKVITEKGFAREELIYRRGLWVLDQSFVDKQAAASTGTLAIPGIRIYSEDTMASGK